MTREEFWMTCKPCRHAWIVAYLPMEMAKAARLMANAACPKCGSKKELFVASEADIAEAIIRQKAAATASVSAMLARQPEQERR